MPETVRRGCTGRSVRELQKLLNATGFHCGLVDGAFGSKTEAAVQSFQAARITDEPRGIVNTATWSALHDKTTVPIIVTEIGCHPSTDLTVARSLCDQVHAMVAEGTGQPGAVRSFVRQHVVGEPVAANDGEQCGRWLGLLDDMAGAIDRHEHDTVSASEGDRALYAARDRIMRDAAKVT